MKPTPEMILHRKADKALRVAVRKAAEEHAAKGLLMCVMEDGKVKQVPGKRVIRAILRVEALARRERRATRKSSR